MAIGMVLVGPLLLRVPGQPWKSIVPGLPVGALIGAAIAGVMQATVFADYIRRRTLAYYRKRWERQLTV